MEIVRKLWKAVEDKAEEPERAKLKRDIAQSVDRLKGRIEKSLKVSRPPVQERHLFNRPEEVPERPSVAIKERSSKPRFTEPVPRIYDKDLVEHALSQIPAAISFRTVEDHRNDLIDKIRRGDTLKGGDES